MRKTIKLKYVDCPFLGLPDNANMIIDQNNIFTTRAIEKNYHIEWSDNPDYIICATLGFDFSKYNCVKIALLTENIYPNFNAYDYAIGLVNNFEHNSRFFLLPSCIMRECWRGYYDNVFTRPAFSYDDLAAKKGFCAWVVSNGTYINPIRDKFFYKYSEYKRVDSGGGHLNNVGGRIADKQAFLNQYKFSLARENSKDYTCEKLWQAFASHTIPVYWGNPEIGKEYNTKAFVNFYDYGSVEKTLKRVIEIDNNDDLFMQMMHEPAYINPKTYDQHMKELEDFFIKIFETPIEDSKRDITFRSYELVEAYGRKQYYQKNKRKEIVKQFLIKLYHPFRNCSVLYKLRDKIFKKLKTDIWWG
jgi:hypothetical protein